MGEVSGTTKPTRGDTQDTDAGLKVLQNNALLLYSALGAPRAGLWGTKVAEEVEGRSPDQRNSSLPDLIANFHTNNQGRSEPMVANPISSLGDGN
ncbi:hypothetical protein PpBr36_08665 [Pyricularia pennisetigena]|uniref:hypothetical protein n=1 Tax=Pyricularia pennisetigena TaxID=1578925 RepID=UPI0011509E67|nr:hypothetical protein PpBr36_08665 [Pyricularia pennisetigena]TLS24827.1 hypothetical protein PpBr36_08665 [Pyricularia pennisetigena]